MSLNPYNSNNLEQLAFNGLSRFDKADYMSLEETFYKHVVDV